jgi:LysR family transcriptional regulator, benzoate and cis,cis-muconate-responsive activator of ben and cat genes
MQSRLPLEGQVFVVIIVQEGSFVRAAQKLGIPVSSLSRRVTLFEKELGVRLFDRSSRKIELTKAGRLFAPEANASLTHAKCAWELARHQALLEHGPIRLGYSAYVHSALLPVLRRLRAPEAETSTMVLESASTIEMVKRVLRGGLHAGIGVLPIRDPDLWTSPIGKEPFYLCLPADHRLAHKATVTVRDLHGEMIFWIPRSGHKRLYDATTKYIHSIGVQVVFQEVRGASHVIEFVGHGFGIGMVPRSAIRVMRTGVVFKPVADQYLRVETALFARKDQKAGPLQSVIDDLLFRLKNLKLGIQ